MSKKKLPFAGEPVVPNQLPAIPPAALDADTRAAILNDSRFDECRAMAITCLKGGLNAGSHFHEVWIRDLNTFLIPALEAVPPQQVRSALLDFLHFQNDKGDIPDGVVEEKKHDSYYKHFRRADSLPGRMAMKNSVSADQETSFVQALARYVTHTEDRSILRETHQGRSCLDHALDALEFLWTERWSPTHGLICNAATIDWHDVQPEDSHGLEMSESTHRAVGVYSNALALLALDDLFALDVLDAEQNEKWRGRRTALAAAIREVLWDAERGKFVPHRYLEEGSPFPPELDEDAIFFPLGTGLAIRAGLLSEDEISRSWAATAEAVRRAGAASIGFSPWPPYPAGCYAAKGIQPWGYANGGDWTWWGAQTAAAYADAGYVAEAYKALLPMVERVLRDREFFEWYDRHNVPAGKIKNPSPEDKAKGWGALAKGAAQFRGAAGTLVIAIDLLRELTENGRVAKGLGTDGTSPALYT
ncbi:MAG: hypothetical protein JJU29_00715 [Verrucomicrobia bacterium]|nr:hypothetical protein [Verrucomicrobiota bacterium]MCH8510436.1 hypothetical protein [Kiritimatiellia bacterium]